MDKRLVYENIFECIDAQNEFCTKLENLGLRFEYGDGPIGKYLEGNLNRYNEIIIEVLGLHEKQHPKSVHFSGQRIPITLAVLYAEDEDVNWAITMDDFFEVLYDAQNNSNLKAWLYEAIVERDQKAKDAITKHYGQVKIGVQQYLEPAN